MLRRPIETTDYQERGLARHLIQALLDIDDGADEVRRNAIVAACANDVVPQLATLLLRP